MFKNRFFIITLSSLIMLLGLSQGATALAEEATQPMTLPFSYFHGEPLFTSASHFLPDIDDEVLILFQLPVTETMLNAVLAGATEGLSPAVIWQTEGSIEVFGSGSGNYNARVFVAIDHADGSRTILSNEEYAASADETRPAIEKIERGLTSLDEWLDFLQVGDTLIVGAMAKGAALVGGDERDLATVQWEVMGYETPQLRPALCLAWDFLNCWPSK